MIEITFWILVVIVWCVLVGSVFIRFLDHGATDLKAWVLGAIGVLMLAWGINVGIEYGERNPCALYESRPIYNSATKTMMPMRVCIERGEWVE